jgi:hypothetical protein
MLAVEVHEALWPECVEVREVRVGHAFYLVGWEAGAFIKRMNCINGLLEIGPLPHTCCIQGFDEAIPCPVVNVLRIVGIVDEAIDIHVGLMCEWPTPLTGSRL